MNDRMRERLEKVQRLDGTKSKKRRKPKEKPREIERFTEAEGVPNKSELADMVQSAINEFCDTYEVDSMRKETQPIWGACCQYIGERVMKRTGYMHDRERERAAPVPGMTIYSDDRLEEGMELWAFLCGIYNKVPLIWDFCNFCGVHYGITAEDGISPRRAKWVKTLRELQEGGATRHVIDGKNTPIGTLAFLNHFYGWNTNKDITQSRETAVLAASDLPKLGPTGGKSGG